MTLRVSLAPARGLGHGASAAPPLLAPGGARVVLGAPSRTSAPATPIAPGADTLFGPRGACLVAPDGPLIVCDTGHHRLLVWRRAPATDHAPADFVIGQPDIRAEGRNGGGAPGPATLSVPTGIAVEGEVWCVADAWNHRVLLWFGQPQRANHPADVVLGQTDFASNLANRGSSTPGADTLNWCYGVAIHGGRLFVADTGNRRVLVWNRIPETNAAPADLVLGQHEFTRRDEGAGAAPGAVGMRWPHAIAAAAGRLFVADAGSSRVMVWAAQPQRSGAPCDFVLGQRDFAAGDHNRGTHHPTASTLNMPYGLTVQGAHLVVADTANSRLLGFDSARLAMGMPASRLAGQVGVDAKGDNRWRSAARDSLCWPYGAAACGTTVVVADSGNNRVLLWEAA